ncbi:hypothetical protein [Burkholderia stagnalis]|uniref:hypothetical protein n=1 Tax=Burkholderia stagnalis TaxID=1503054 RepID=UPI0007533351|nr:hypothetical protein [Burkholderia stagnalis]KVO61188.1 hypothetical protein WT18_08055 [Burkholderia stagnalis]KVP12795.1 hypothetical protein WT20_09765 [Burkholderia stagnalis]KVW96302.1 hypothetical protein WT30_10825 [Burkholderia stagnalis]KWH75425.1 hypothetical protein WT66_01055 [Burkholderia stagnalis]
MQFLTRFLDLQVDRGQLLVRSGIESIQRVTELGRRYVILRRQLRAPLNRPPRALRVAWSWDGTEKMRWLAAVTPKLMTVVLLGGIVPIMALTRDSACMTVV